MTEEEAKKRWCPFARCFPDNSEGMTDGAGNRWTLDQDDKPNAFGNDNKCIGSACMAWRWFHPGHDPDLPRQFPDVIGSELNKRRDIGFCGLAGKP